MDLFGIKVLLGLFQGLHSFIGFHTDTVIQFRYFKEN